MKVFIKTLGCAKNFVEAETIVGDLLNSGIQPTTSLKNADVVLIHTCAFIDDARKESIDEIKRVNTKKKIIVTGCLPQYFKNNRDRKLAALFKKTSYLVGTGELNRIPQIILNGHKTKNIISKPGGLINSSHRLISNNLPWTYMRVAEGCDHRCNYCLIPLLRGPYRSRPLKNILEEAKKLVDCGIKEVNLISQDTAGYGRDFSDGTNIIKLLRGLEKINGIKWIRLLYCHPNSVSNDLINYIRDSSKVVHYLDIPLQHISDSMLSVMGRKTTQKKLRKLLEKIYKKIPNIALRTTFIVGHPGETSDDFKELCNFVKEGYFLWTGLFKYSRQKNTISGSLGDESQVDETEKERRYNILKRIADSVTKKKYRSMISKSSVVLVETATTGRTYLSAPEVDGVVLFDKNLPDGVKVGDFVKFSIFC